MSILTALLVVAIISGFCGLLVGARLKRKKADAQDFIRTIFTPEEDGLAHYLAALRSARKSILMADFILTEPSVIELLVQKSRSDEIDVRALLSQSQLSGRSFRAIVSAAQLLLSAGVDVSFADSKNGCEMHCKFSVIDGCLVIDGSYNPTRQGGRQDNHINFIASVKRAKLFAYKWFRMRRTAKSLSDSLQELRRTHPAVGHTVVKKTNKMLPGR